jgi:hypothetical protein
MGEQKNQVFEQSSRVAVDTFAGRIHVEWDPEAAVTPMGQLPFFIEFLKVSGVYGALGDSRLKTYHYEWSNCFVLDISMESV